MEPVTEKNIEINSITYLNDAEYFKQRLEKQLKFYNVKARENKAKYKYYKRFEFILAASIPVLIGVSAYFSNINLFSFSGSSGVVYFTLATALQIIAAFSGIILAFINKIIELDEYYKTWKDYRLTHELLYNQKILYLTKTEPYNKDDAYKVLIKNVENILSQEVQKWNIQAADENRLTEAAILNIEKMYEKLVEKSSDDTTKEDTDEEVVKTETEEIKS